MGSVSTYTIGEIAERSGFTASSLRYYEGIGLVSRSTRTPAGYRLYDDHALDRLAFIARAKQLGCSLEEITDLVGDLGRRELWAGAATVPRSRHRPSIADAQRQITELTELVTQLQSAAAQLAGPPVDGACGPDCACISATTAMVTLTRKSSVPA